MISWNYKTNTPVQKLTSDFQKMKYIEQYSRAPSPQNKVDDEVAGGGQFFFSTSKLSLTTLFWGGGERGPTLQTDVGKSEVSFCTGVADLVD